MAYFNILLSLLVNEAVNLRVLLAKLFCSGGVVTATVGAGVLVAAPLSVPGAALIAGSCEVAARSPAGLFSLKKYQPAVINIPITMAAATILYTRARLVLRGIISVVGAVVSSDAAMVSHVPAGGVDS